MRVLLDRQRRDASIAATSIALAVLVAGSSARAQSAEAEALFDDGERLMAEGNVARACEAFQSSNLIDPRAGTLIRLGDCREHNEQLVSALFAYKGALTRVKDPYKREVATARAAALEPRLSYLTVRVPDASRLDGLVITRNGVPLDPLLWNRELPVDGGDYVLVGGAPGHERWQTTVHVPVERARVTVEMPELKKPSDDERRSDRMGDGGLSTRRKLALSSGALAAVALINGGVFALRSRGKASAAEKLCTFDFQCTSEGVALVNDARISARVAYVSYGVGMGAAVAAAALWFAGAPGRASAGRDARTHITPLLRPELIGLGMEGRF